MFFAVKFWNFVGLIYLLFAGRSFNCLTGMVFHHSHILVMLLYFNMSLSLVSWQRSFFEMSFGAINIYFCWSTDGSACEHIYLCHNLQVPKLWKFIGSVQFRLLSLEHHRTNYYYYSISNLVHYTMPSIA